jgi:Mitochondrial ribosomal protein (VAR1)
MLNLFKLNLNKTNKKPINNHTKKSLKHFPSSIREWNNSIYVYNKNAINLIPTVTLSATNLIKSYFNLYNYVLERKMRKERLLLRLRRLSSNKIYVSTGEFKHTNNNVIITLYLYNRQKHNYILRIKKEYLNIFKLYKKRLNKKINLIKLIALDSIKKANREKYLIIKTLNNTQTFSIKNSKSLSEYITLFYKKVVEQSFAKLSMYMYYRQLIYINNTKYSYIFLQNLKKYLEKIYNKNVEFNLINLKHFYLNSDILSEAITLKITRNRRKILKYLNNLKKKVKTQKKNWLLHVFLKKNKLNLKQKFNNKLYLKNFVINNLKYRHVTGFRLEAKGRLTRRYTASRSVSKLRYKGNLMNIDSSYKGLSSVLLKGNLRSNVQYTKLNSKTRIGSFGIKGWVSGN